MSPGEHLARRRVTEREYGVGDFDAFASGPKQARCVFEVIGVARQAEDLALPEVNSDALMFTVVLVSFRVARLANKLYGPADVAEREFADEWVVRRHAKGTEVEP